MLVSFIICVKDAPFALVCDMSIISRGGFFFSACKIQLGQLSQGQIQGNPTLVILNLDQSIQHILNDKMS